METNHAIHRQIRRLEEKEKIESFCCGDADLDDFIVNEATVDAYRSAILFYEKNGFLPLQVEDDGEHTRLMFFDLADYKNQLQ